VGINPKCGILRSGTSNSIGNIANILACSMSMAVTIWLIVRCNHRKAAVGTSVLLSACAVGSVLEPSSRY